MRHVAECPTCGTEYPTTIESAQDGVRCGRCAAIFVPETLKQYEDLPKPLPAVPAARGETKPDRTVQQQRDRVQRLRAAGESTWNAAIVLFCAAGLAFVIALIMLGHDSVYWGGAVTVAGACLSLALCLTLFSHLNHIRAELVK